MRLKRSEWDMATIVDVAKRAGVSVATVSRAMNSNHIVTQEKRNKVYQAMEELNYQPRVARNNEKTNDRKIIVVLTTVMIEELISGIYDRAGELNYEVIISYVTKNQQNIESIETLKNAKIAGVIIFNALLRREELAEIGLKLPVIQCLQSVEMPKTFIVAIDDEKAAFDSVTRLIEQGKKRIGFIGLEENEEAVPYFSKERYRGYRRALDEAMIDYDRSMVKYSDLTYDGGVVAAKEFLAMKQKPDAVFCVQDTLAAACINVFKDAGMAIPEDVAISGFDNAEISQIISPKLTTVEQPFYEIGYETVNMVDALINEDISTGRRLLIDHRLIERESTLGKNTKNND